MLSTAVFVALAEVPAGGLRGRRVQSVLAVTVHVIGRIGAASASAAAEEVFGELHEGEHVAAWFTTLWRALEPVVEALS